MATHTVRVSILSLANLVAAGSHSHSLRISLVAAGFRLLTVTLLLLQSFKRFDLLPWRQVLRCTTSTRRFAASSAEGAVSALPASELFFGNR